MNERLYSVAFLDGDDVRYGYVEHATLPDVMRFARGMGDSEYRTEVRYGEKLLVWWDHEGPDHVMDPELYFELTHWEVNASWVHDDYYGEFVSLGYFDSEAEAIDYVEALAHTYREHVVWDVGLFDADAISLDVRAAGPNTFEYGTEVTRDGLVA